MSERPKNACHKDDYNGMCGESQVRDLGIRNPLRVESLIFCALVADPGIMLTHQFAFYSLSSCLFLLTIDILEDVVPGFQGPAPCFRYKIECPSRRRRKMYKARSLCFEPKAE